MSERKINKLIESYNYRTLLSFPVIALILIGCCLEHVIFCMIVTWLSYIMLLSGLNEIPVRPTEIEKQGTGTGAIKSQNPLLKPEREINKKYK